MVYCGKPSRGCQMCRTRRIKCDETRPTCLQCQKSRRQCPGYKDDFDLVFRNETQATEKRARKNLNKRQRLNTDVPSTVGVLERSASTDDSTPSSAGSQGSGSPPSATATSATTASSSVSNSLSVPLEDRARNHFLSNFVLIARQGTTRGFMEYLIPLLSSEGSEGTPLPVAFNAVALAALGNRPGSKQLLIPAVEQYNKAIREVNTALRDPVSQRTDQTLASVLLLGLFETLTSRRTAITAWGSHIEGAVMIVKMRGKKQLRTKIGHALFIAVRTQMMINCLSASRAPDLGTEWWITDAVKEQTSQGITHLSLLTAELRADVNRSMMMIARTPENIELVLDFMRRARQIEQAFLEWEANVPDIWKYKTAAWVDNVAAGDVANSEVFPGKIDVYADMWIASVWNNARVSRLFISGIVVRCAAWLCAPVDYRTTPEYAAAARLGVDMINDLIASIPFFLGYKSDQEIVGLTPEDVSGFACGDDGPGARKSLGAYFCIWPLFSTLCSDFATDSQRAWIKGRMRYMKEHMGINQAGTLSYFDLRLPSMIIKRDGMGLAAPNPRLLSSPAGASPAAGYTANPLLSKPRPAPNEGSLRPSVFMYPMQRGGNGFGMIDMEFERAQKELEEKQKEAWERQRGMMEKRREELVIAAAEAPPPGLRWGMERFLQE